MDFLTIFHFLFEGRQRP